MHVALSGETTGYYADFEPLEALAKVCEKGFFHDGTFSSFRERDHGTAVDTEHMPTWRLVVANQNHDQIGNRARGDRLAEHLDDDQLACAALLTLAGPFTPMLFMGEEWAASTPFAVLHLPPRARARQGDGGRPDRRVREDGLGPRRGASTPRTPRRSRRSKLDWDELSGGRHAVVLDCYRRLGRLRRELPQLTDPAFGSVSCTVEGRLFTMRRGDLLVVVNAGDTGRDDRGGGARGALRDPCRGRRARRGAVGAGARRNSSRAGRNFLLTGGVSLVERPVPGPTRRG